MITVFLFIFLSALAIGFSLMMLKHYIFLFKQMPIVAGVLLSISVLLGFLPADWILKALLILFVSSIAMYLSAKRKQQA